MTIFKLPDLGEGLAEAEIVEWLVKPGDHVREDQHLVSVETAKAVVDIPSPFHGVIKKLHGNPGDMIPVGNALIEFMSDEAEASTTVAGKLEIGEATVEETARILKPEASAAQVKATPAIRAMAKQLNVDLTKISGTGPQNAITREDVQKASVPQASKSLHGARRAMAKVMTEAHAQIVPVTIYDDANINAWAPGTDITVRTIRALVKACQAEPALNAWFKNNEHQLHPHLNLGLAMDTTDGLFVPVLSEVDTLFATPQKIREQVNHYKKVVEERTVKPSELQGATFTLSNFGMFAGRYANPIIVQITPALR